MEGKCVRCGECCFAFEVPEISKPDRTWCRHFERGSGSIGVCKIYDSRPQSCRIFILAGVDGECILGKAIRKARANHHSLTESLTEGVPEPV